MIDDNYKTKKYLHFDNRISYSKVKNYVIDKNKISKHSFFPFIKYVQKFEKYNENILRNRPVKVKERPIMYAAHLDGFIYKYYGEKLNFEYNKWVIKNGIDSCITAYRNNKSGKNNIHFSAEVIGFIQEKKDCYIIVGDYKGFFDSLNHIYLKERIKQILNVERLEEYQYNIFKSITKYSYIYKRDINIELGKDKKISRKYFNNIEDFRKFKKRKGVINKNKSGIGIPQGTSMSAVLANIYMIQVDSEINKMVINKSGIYRRYSDDFIIIIPKNNIVEEEFYELIEEIKIIIKKANLVLQDEKTRLLRFKSNKVIDFKNNKKCTLDYLGFVFDGENVSIRQRSIYKYYRNAYRLINRSKIKLEKLKCNRLPYKRDIYRLYTELGEYTNLKYGYQREYHGNFITYAKRAQIIFDKICNTNNLMNDQIKNHRSKIQNRIKEVNIRRNI